MDIDGMSVIDVTNYLRECSENAREYYKEKWEGEKSFWIQIIIAAIKSYKRPLMESTLLMLQEEENQLVITTVFATVYEMAQDNYNLINGTK